MKTKKSLFGVIIFILLLASLGFLVFRGCSVKKSTNFSGGSGAQSATQEKAEETSDFNLTAKELQTKEGVAKFTKYYNTLKKEGTVTTELTPEEIIESYLIYQEVNSTIYEINDKYIDSDGYVKSENVQTVLEKVYDHALKLKDEGKIMGATYNEEYMNVCIVLSDGKPYIYSPEIKGLMSGGQDLDVLAINCGKWFETIDATAIYKTLSLSSLNKAGEYIEKKLDVNSYRYEDNSTIGINQVKVLLKSLDTDKRHILLWRGHGNVWDYEAEKNISATAVSDTKESVFWLDADVSVDDYLIYIDDILAGNVILTGSSFALSPSFFDTYMPQIKGGIFYTGACYSAADGGVMSGALLGKGFDCYMGASDTITQAYSDLMLLSVTENLCVFADTLTSPDPSALAVDTSVSTAKKTITAQQALDRAKQACGSYDVRGTLEDAVSKLPEIFSAKLRKTQVVLKGDSSFRLIGADDLDLPFSAVKNIGNNPNNLWQGEKCLAFDKDYIYYVSNDNLHRVTYQGTKNELVAEDIEGLLNVYDGYVYSFDDGTAGTPYAKIKRVNTKTKETEVIFERNGSAWREDYCVSSLLVYDGYVFFSLKDEGNTQRTYIYAIDIETLNLQLLHFESAGRGLEFTADSNGNLYAIIKTNGSNANERRILSINTSDLREQGSASSMTEIVGEKDLGYYAAIIHGSGGLMRFSSTPPAYREYYFGEIDKANLNWYSSGKKYQDFDDEFMKDDLATVITGRNQRYVLGNNLLVFATDTLYTKKAVWGSDTETTPIFLYEGMDFTSPKEVGRVSGINLFQNGDNLMGVYDNKMYIIEKTNTETSLITIASNGKLSKVAI